MCHESCELYLLSCCFLWYSVLSLVAMIFHDFSCHSLPFFGLNHMRECSGRFNVESIFIYDKRMNNKLRKTGLESIGLKMKTNFVTCLECKVWCLMMCIVFNHVLVSIIKIAININENPLLLRLCPDCHWNCFRKCNIFFGQRRWKERRKKWKIDKWHEVIIKIRQ